jgi:hypothetical protein
MKGEPEPFEWKAPHHGYIGAFILFLSYLMSQSYWATWSYVLMAFIGVYLLVDDIYEHRVNKRTPLRLLFERIMLKYVK